MKYSNYKVVTCFNLFFRGVTFYLNAGSILAFAYFLGYLGSFILFLFRRFKYLTIEINKLFVNDNENEIKNDDSKHKHDIKNIKKEITLFKKDIFKSNRNDIHDTEFLRKKKYSSKIFGNSNLILKNIEPIGEKEELGKTNDKNLSLKTTVIRRKQAKFLIKKQDKRNFEDNKELKDDFEENNYIGSKEFFKKKLSLLEPNKNIKILKIKHVKIKDDRNLNEKSGLKADKKKEVDLTDFEYNNLEYLKAIELDNRNFFRVYWSLLKREHTIIFTFAAWNDFNIFSIKLSKFFFLICTDMALNVFFFSDDSMHNLYESQGTYNFMDSLIQMIYTTVISQLLQIFLNYLTMTDIHYYQIKAMKNDNDIKNKISAMFKCIKYKIIIYFIFSFLLFLFYWYIIACFCAVYENTQKIFIIDSISSFLLGLAYPFVLYLFPAGLRLLSLKAKEKKNLKFLYCLSDVIPFF